jgi:hypothetical protein
MATEIDPTPQGIVKAAKAFTEPGSAGGVALTPNEVKSISNAAMRSDVSGYKIGAALEKAGFPALGEVLITGNFDQYVEAKWGEHKPVKGLPEGTKLGEMDGEGFFDTALTVASSKARIFGGKELKEARLFAAASSVRSDQDMAVVRTTRDEEQVYLVIPLEETGLTPEGLEADSIEMPEGHDLVSLWVGSEAKGGLGEWIHPDYRKRDNLRSLWQVITNQ